MANPRTEVILAPKIDRSDLNTVKESMNSAFEDVANKSKKELEKKTKRGVEDGIKSGGDKGIGFLKKGLVGLAAAVGAAAMNAAMGADEVIARMEARLINIRDIGKEAKAFDVSSGEYAQAASIFTSLGYDQSDLRGVLAGFQAEFDKPEMAKFKDIADQSGVLQSLMSFIASTAEMTQTDRSARLAPLGDEDAVIASAIAARIKSSGAVNMQQLFEKMTGTTYTADQLTKKITAGETESDKLSRYQSQVYLEDIIKGGSADDIRKSVDLDRRLENAHDANIGTKLAFKEITVTAEIASLNAASATIEGLTPWFENANKVLNNLDESVKKTSEKGVTGILNYQPFSTEPNREKDEFLDFLFRGPIWDWFENSNSKSDQQDYTK